MKKMKSILILLVLSLNLMVSTPVSANSMSSYEHEEDIISCHVDPSSGFNEELTGR
jgi:hypothetical protein